MKLDRVTGLSYNTSNLRVCVNSVAGGKISGRVYSMRLTLPIDFFDISDFLLKVEKVLDVQGFPQSFQRKRVFGRETGADSPYVVDGEAFLDERAVSSTTGKLLTFTVQILSRMNTTWQGFIDWLDDGERSGFESVLQFIDLLDKRLMNG